MKYLNYRFLILFMIVLISFFFIYSNYFQKNKISQNINLEVKKESSTNSNIIKDIKYFSQDLKGNQYTIIANEGEIDLDNSEIIFLKDVNAFIELIENNETITVVSDFGKYNTFNYNTIFSKNVKINYKDNSITGDYLDFSMMENMLIISKNVVYKNPTNTLKADVIELDTITKDTKIFMHNSEDKVNIEGRN
tara:strand:+ start:747 stop:1325 length:579 start_codon:yes stop_codon:yes gene_type:complete